MMQNQTKNKMSIYHKQTFRNSKLNHACAHVIRNGQVVTLTAKQKELFLQNICDTPKNPISLCFFLGMAIYISITGIFCTLIFAIAYIFNQINVQISHYLYIIAIICLLLILTGFICLNRWHRKKTDAFKDEAFKKIKEGDYQAYMYQIEEIFRYHTFDVDNHNGYLHLWYRVKDVVFELKNTSFVYDLGKNNEIIYREPEKIKANEYNHPLGGYILGIIICLGGQEYFYGI